MACVERFWIALYLTKKNSCSNREIQVMNLHLVPRDLLPGSLSIDLPNH